MPMVDCRSLIEFCRAFEQHRVSGGGRHVKRSKSLSPLSHHSLCEHSPFAAADIAILALALAALAVLAAPILREASELLFHLLRYALCRAPAAYALGFVLAAAAAAAGWELVSHQARKCGSPRCRGLKKAVEFDIQLESEECVRCLPPDAAGARPLELGEDHKELEAELRKMAPLNGRTVLIFRAPCGCLAGRMEVWGPKKARRIKK